MTTDYTGRPETAASDDLTPAKLILDLSFSESDLVGLRSAVAAHASAAGMDDHHIEVLVFIAYELSTNAVRHGGGHGRLRLWRGDDDIHCQVSDHGPGLPQAMTTPAQPPLAAASGRGLWLVHTFADTFTATSDDTGASVVATMRLNP